MNRVFRRILVRTSYLVLSVALPTAVRADRVIDAFSDLLPSITLPGSSTPAGAEQGDGPGVPVPLTRFQ